MLSLTLIFSCFKFFLTTHFSNFSFWQTKDGFDGRSIFLLENKFSCSDKMTGLFIFLYVDICRYMGTITGISDLDPVRWKNSQWRNLQVGFLVFFPSFLLLVQIFFSDLQGDCVFSIGWLGWVGSRRKAEQGFNLGNWTGCCSIFYMPSTIFWFKTTQAIRYALVLISALVVAGLLFCFLDSLVDQGH